MEKMLKDADIQRGMDHSLNLMKDELCTTNASESVSPEMDQLQSLEKTSTLVELQKDSQTMV